MYEGWFTYGGVEVVNLERLAAYVAAGLVPPETTVDPPGPYDGLAGVLGDAPYTTPVMDEAPWYRLSVPATHRFAGVLPLSITGLDGTTRTTAMEERTGDGGLAVQTRRATRTIAVTAALIGEDDEAVTAGLEWLTSVLQQRCDTTNPCRGVTLDGLLTMPGPVYDTEDVTAPLEPHEVSTEVQWLTSGGAWTPGTPGVFKVARAVEYDGGAADQDSGGTETLVVLDGHLDPDTDTVPPTVLDGNAPEGEGMVAAPYTIGCLSEVTATWEVSPLDGESGVEVWVGTVNPQGVLLERSFYGVVSAPTTIEWSRQFIAWEEWQPALWVGPPGIAVDSLTVSTHPDVDPASCTDPYWRTFHDVRCIDGPKVLDSTPTDECGGVLTTVEWTWAAANPYRHGRYVDLATDLPATVSLAEPTYLAPGVSWTQVEVAATDSNCPAPTTAATTCATDPDLAPLVAPPALPVVAETHIADPESGFYYRDAVLVGPSALPTVAAAALRVRITADEYARRPVRLRIYSDTTPVAMPVTPELQCSFEYELWVTYLPPDATLVIDAAEGRAYVECADGTTPDASTLLRGAYKSASWRFPVLPCDDRYYLVTLDTPSGLGFPTWSLAATPQEG